MYVQGGRNWNRTMSTNFYFGSVRLESYRQTEWVALPPGCLKNPRPTNCANQAGVCFVWYSAVLAGLPALFKILTIQKHKIRANVLNRSASMQKKSKRWVSQARVERATSRLQYTFTVWRHKPTRRPRVFSSRLEWSQFVVFVILVLESRIYIQLCDCRGALRWGFHKNSRSPLHVYRRTSYLGFRNYIVAAK